MEINKLVTNLYKYGDSKYRILLDRKNTQQKKIKIDLYFEAENDAAAILYLHDIYKNNNIEISKKTNGTNKWVSKYVYRYGKNYYRICIHKTKNFPEGYSHYYYDNLENVKKIRDSLLENKNTKYLYKEFTLNKFFYDEFIPKYCEGLSPLTITSYINDFENFINLEFGNQKLLELEDKVDDFHLFVKKLKTTKKKHLTKIQEENNDIYISTKYQNTIYNHLNTIFKIAVDFKRMKANPMDSIKPPKFKSKKTSIYNINEVYKILTLLEESDIRERFMISLFICSGLRCGELVGLHVSDFDFEKNCIHVTRNVVYDSIKKITIEKKPKSSNGERTIYLPTFVMDYAKIWLLERKKQVQKYIEREQRLRNSVYEDPRNMFLNKFGKIMNPSEPNKIWSNWRNKNGLGYVTAHGLRTTFATTQYQENKNLTERELAIVMGHSKNLKMLRHYTQEDNNKIPNTIHLFSDYKTKKDNIKNKLEYNDNGIYLTFDQLYYLVNNNACNNSMK